jgi:hypothetical protein
MRMHNWTETYAGGQKNGVDVGVREDSDEDVISEIVQVHVKEVRRTASGTR